MGDMAEDFAALRDHHKERRANNLAKADTSGFTQHTEYHFSTVLQGERLDYWPSGNKWRWKKKTYHGNVHGFIKNRKN